MSPIFRQPDLLDRTRLAAVTVLAAFAALSLLLVSHLAGGVPLPVSGLPGEGLLLPAPAASGPDGTAQADGGSSVSAPTSIPASTSTSVPALGSEGDRGGQGGGVVAGAPDANTGPREVGISIGTAAPAQPGATPQTPGAATTPVTGTGSGTAGSGGGSEDTDNPTTIEPGPANNWGHGPTAPTGSGRNPSAGSSGTTASSSGSSAAAGASPPVSPVKPGMSKTSSGVKSAGTAPALNTKPGSTAGKSASATKAATGLSAVAKAPGVKQATPAGTSSTSASSALGAKAKGFLSGQSK